MPDENGHHIAIWGQWDWPDTGPGQWHYIAKRVPPIAVILACGRARPIPNSIHRGTPPRELCCPRCLSEQDAHDNDLTYEEAKRRAGQLVPAGRQEEYR